MNGIVIGPTQNIATLDTQIVRDDSEVLYETLVAVSVTDECSRERHVLRICIYGDFESKTAHATVEWWDKEWYQIHETRKGTWIPCPDASIPEYTPDYFRDIRNQLVTIAWGIVCVQATFQTHWK